MSMDIYVAVHEMILRNKEKSLPTQAFELKHRTEDPFMHI